MAYRVIKSVAWRAGEGTPIKYQFDVDASLSVVSFINQVATVNLAGSVTVHTHPYNSQNSYAASDFSVLVPVNVDPTSHPFITGVSYYEQALPFLPDPQNGDTQKMLIQFRGDTWRSDPVNNRNRTSLWIKAWGLVMNQFDQEGSNQFNINETFEVPINASGNTPILVWDSSGAGPNDYSWMNRDVWASWFDLDYRPGAILNSGWKSHNRSGGVCHILTSGGWNEMRTVGAPTAIGDPPSIYHGGKWYNGARIGVE